MLCVSRLRNGASVNRPGARHLRPSTVVLSEEETQRMRKFVARCGVLKVAMERLGLCSTTFDSARDFGRMQDTTRLRVLEALAREEAKL